LVLRGGRVLAWMDLATKVNRLPPAWRLTFDDREDRLDEPAARLGIACRS
jgi:hypothetical protein